MAWNAIRVVILTPTPTFAMRHSVRYTQFQGRHGLRLGVVTGLCGYMEATRCHGNKTSTHQVKDIRNDTITPPFSDVAEVKQAPRLWL